MTITTPPSLWSALPATKLPTSDKLDYIRVTHINIRQSISFVLIKLISVEIIAGIGVIVLHGILFSTSLGDILGNLVATFNASSVSLFILIVVIKVYVSIWIIVDWLNKYYEITPSMLIYRRGLIFKKEDEYVFSHLMSIDLQQSFWGKILNYGNIHLYDRYINKHIYMYQIHNPLRYFSILKNLIPYTDSAQEVIRESVLEDQEGGV